ncbi:MAG: hypothetical protein DMG37_11660 [Acidobacteria bacterium]|nr:MAG: hypothetical protein DMG37_11660 [Acidobacteriota bacterium]
MDQPEIQKQPIQRTPAAPRDSIRTLHEFIFSLNIASAFVYALLVYISMNQASTTLANDSTYYFLRSAFRINDLLHLPSANSVSTSALARELRSRWSQVGDELLFLVSTLGVASLVLLLLRLIAGTSSYQLILSRIAGLTAFFTTPACYLYISKLTWNWASAPFSVRHYTFWQSAPAIVFVAEIFCFGILFAIYRKRPITAWTSRILLFFHYAFWVLVVWPEVWVSTQRLYAPYLLVLAFPLSGILWLHYLKSLDFHAVETGHPGHLGRAGKWILITSVTSVAALLYIWLPSKSYDFSHPKSKARR